MTADFIPNLRKIEICSALMLAASSAFTGALASPSSWDGISHISADAASSQAESQDVSLAEDEGSLLKEKILLNQLDFVGRQAKETCGSNNIESVAVRVGDDGASISLSFTCHSEESEDVEGQRLPPVSDSTDMD